MRNLRDEIHESIKVLLQTEMICKEQFQQIYERIVEGDFKNWKEVKK